MNINLIAMTMVCSICAEEDPPRKKRGRPSKKDKALAASINTTAGGASRGKSADVQRLKQNQY